MEIEFIPGEDGGYGIDIEFDIGIGTGDVDVAKLDEHDVQLLVRTVTAARLKLNEADFFLKMMGRYFRHEAATHYHFNAFLTALKGVLDILPHEGVEARKSEFTRWRKARDKELRQDSAVAMLLQLRNSAVHQGGEPPHLGFGVALREHLDGRRTLEPAAELIGLAGKPVEAPLLVCGAALARVRQVVDEAEAAGFLRKKDRDGHTIQLKLLKEYEPGIWHESPPEEMDMLGRKMPRISLGPGTVKRPDGRVETVPGFMPGDDGRG